MACDHSYQGGPYRELPDPDKVRIPPGLSKEGEAIYRRLCANFGDPNDDE